MSAFYDPLTLKKTKQKNVSGKSNDPFEKHSDLCLDFFYTFTSPRGSKVLDFLKSKTLDQPCWNPNYGANAERHAFAREGQNNVLREILKLIEAGRNLKND